MKPPPFEYVAPDTVDAALSLLAEHGDEAKVLAGGQSLVPLLNFRLARPSVLVDVNRVSGLDGIALVDGQVVVGSLTRERAAERSELVAGALPLMAAALPLIGHAAIRTRGTIGGSVAHADPAAELPAVALALDAEIVVRSAARGERRIPASEFFLGYFTTAMEPDELLTGIRFPAAPTGLGASFEEAVRRSGDFAMVGVAAALQVEGGTVKDARLSFIGVADTPVRSREVEASLVGATPDADAFAAAAADAMASLDPPGDVHASSAYRRHVAGALVRRSLERAATTAGANA